MTVLTDFAQIGRSATAANNFILTSDGAGGFKLSRGTIVNGVATPISDVLAIDSVGNVTIASGKLSQTNDSAYTSASAPVFPTTGAFGDAVGSIWYRKLGRTVFFRATITIASNGSGAGAVNLTMPFAGAGVEQVFIGREGLSIGFPFVAYLRGSTLTMYKMDTTYPGGNNYTLYISGSYESAT